MKSTLIKLKSSGLMLFVAALILTTSCQKQEQVLLSNAADGDAVLKEKTSTTSPVKVIADHYFVDVVPGEIAKATAQIVLHSGDVISVFEELNLIEAHSTSTTFAKDLKRTSSVIDVIRSLEIDYNTGEMSALNTNSIFNPSGITGSNPYYDAGLQWPHTAIETADAWAMNETGAGATVAILDGGFFPDHPDIAANVLDAISFVPGEGATQAFEAFSHGTHVAGIVAAADNDIGCLGVAPDAALHLVKVLPDAGSGPFGPILSGIIYAADLDDVDLMNMSLGGSIPLASVPPQLMWDLRGFLNYVNRGIQYANQKGKLVIIAAGNDAVNPRKDNYIIVPAMAPQAFSVSSLGPNNYFDDLVNGTSNADFDLQAYYTNYGIQMVDVSASGGNIDFGLLAAFYNSGGTDTRVFYDLVISPSGSSSYYWAQGTSMASPQAAGVAALIVGKYGSMSPKALKTKLFQSAEDLGKSGRDELHGHGRVNAHNAVK
jgi:subtilisin family serine protease